MVYFNKVSHIWDIMMTFFINWLLNSSGQITGIWEKNQNQCTMKSFFKKIIWCFNHLTRTCSGCNIVLCTPSFIIFAIRSLTNFSFFFYTHATKKVTSNFWQCISHFGVFRIELQKYIYKTYMFYKKKIVKFCTKKASFSCFWDDIWINHWHFWNSTSEFSIFKVSWKRNFKFGTKNSSFWCFWNDVWKN